MDNVYQTVLADNMCYVSMQERWDNPDVHTMLTMPKRGSSMKWHTLVCFDVECTMKGWPAKDPSPWWSENTPVRTGWAIVDAGKEYDTIRYRSGTISEFLVELYAITASNSVLLIGHNLKFDLNWIGNRNTRDTYWDTQLFEYLRTGQKESFKSLDSLATDLFGIGKDTTVPEMWRKGLDTDEIPKDILEYYLMRDVYLTLGAHAFQRSYYENHMDDHCKSVVQIQMALTPVLSKIEQTGWHIDKEFVEQQHLDSGGKVKKLEQALTHLIHQELGFNEATDRNWNALSNRGVSAMLFGYPTPQWERRTPNGVTKGGKPKFKWNPISPYKATGTILAGCAKDFTAVENLKANKTLGFSVSDTILKKVIATHKPTDLATIIAKGVIALRKHNKLDSTYWSPTLERMQALGKTRIHPTLNQCLTSTGRLSSSNPNSQNQPVVAKQMVVSKKPQGQIWEVDFKQLEVVALALLSDDANLLNDIAKGVDVHTRTGASVFGRAMTKEQRRIVKGVNFGLIYGGSAATLAEQTGVDEATVKKLIKAFYRAYPRVGHWQEETHNAVKSLLKPDGSMAPINGQIPGTCIWQSPTGRRYFFQEKESPDFMKKRGEYVSLSPTNTKNYPVQGFATGDVVPLFLVHLNNELENHNIKVDIIGTVHDSIVLDAYLDTEHDAIERALEKALSLTCTYVAAITYNFADKVNQMLALEIEKGPRWGESTCKSVIKVI